MDNNKIYEQMDLLKQHVKDIQQRFQGFPYELRVNQLSFEKGILKWNGKKFLDCSLNERIEGSGYLPELMKLVFQKEGLFIKKLQQSLDAMEKLYG